MIDCTVRLLSFQQSLLRGEVRLHASEVDPELYVYADQTADAPRFTYVRLIGLVVTAYAVMEMTEPMQGLPCFQAGVAVPEAYRGKGYGERVLEAAIAELKDGLARNNAPSFYVKATIGMNDEAFKKVAQAIISAAPATVTDPVSGLLALEYVRKL
jgi:GNAT superfamily N-acetyltransferase